MDILDRTIMMTSSLDVGIVGGFGDSYIYPVYSHSKEAFYSHSTSYYSSTTSSLSGKISGNNVAPYISTL